MKEKHYETMKADIAGFVREEEEILRSLSEQDAQMTKGNIGGADEKRRKLKILRRKC